MSFMFLDGSGDQNKTTGPRTCRLPCSINRIHRPWHTLLSVEKIFDMKGCSVGNAAQK